MIIIAIAGLWPATVFAQLQLLPGVQPQMVFACQQQKIPVVWNNNSDQNFESEIRIRIFQASSATAMPWAEFSWKKLQILPGQTVLDSCPMVFPAVQAKTQFLMQWIADSNHVIGTTEVWVYPTNLLAELKSLMSGEMLGALDPQNQLKPVLKQNGVDFLDLGETTLEDFSGRLAIIGPFESRTQIRAGLTQAIRRIAQKGLAVVWIQSPPEAKDEVKPSFYIVPEGKGTVVVVQPGLVANFYENPKSQLNLIYFCKLALHPVPPTLPNLSAQP